MADHNSTPSDILNRRDTMKAGRSVFESHWQEVRNVEYPSGDSFISREVAGVKSHQSVFDSTAEQGVELLAAALQGMLTNPATKWFGLKTKNKALMKIEAVAVYLENAANVMLDIFNSPIANFAPNQHEKYMDLVAYGTSGMFIDEDPVLGPLFQTRPLTELMFAENHQGRVDTVYRNFTLTARQAKMEFSKRGDTLPGKIATAANDNKKQDDVFNFVHAIFPRANVDPIRLDPLNMPVASLYVSESDKAFARQSGFPEMPMTMPRWIKRAGEAYGRGPGMKVLADAKMLQRTMKATIRGAEKIIDPSLMVPDDGVLSPVNLSTRGLTFVRGDLLFGKADPVRPIKTGGQPEIGEGLSQGIRDRIGLGFFSHLIRMSQDPRMTATQVLELAETTRQILGPVFGRLQTEDLGPMIDRVFAIELRAGSFGPVPVELDGEALEVEYQSPMAKLQRLTEARGIAQTLEVMGPIIATHPEVLDNFSPDQVFRHVADLFGWPRDTFRSEKLVQEIRSARAEETEKQMAAQQALEAVQVAGKALPGLQKAGIGDQGSGPPQAANAA